MRNKNADEFVCWVGQQGGFEGLRQKGWCILNLLVIKDICKKHETKVEILVQGDDQVVVTNFRLDESIKGQQRI